VTPLAARAADRLRSNRRLRAAYHALRVLAVMQPAHRFASDLLRGAPEGTYRVRRTGQTVTLRPRPDLQVAREHLTRGGYEPPAAVRATARSRAGGGSDIGGGALRLVDLGANIGLSVLSTLARERDATVVAVEPDPANAALLQRNIAQNGLTDRVTVVAAAAGIGPGVVPFAAGHCELSRVAGLGGLPNASTGVIDVEVVDAFALLAGADLVKIDIEGGEWPLLRDPRLRTLDAPVLVMEWHAAGSGVDAPRDEAERLLRSAGYEVIHMGRPLDEAGELWAFRPR
jgi:FkbM family methyltransferase